MSYSSNSDISGSDNNEDDYFDDPVDDSYFDNASPTDSRRRSAEGVYNPFDTKELKFDSMEKSENRSPDYKIKLP